MNEDIEKAKEITIKRGLYKENDSICHGNFGNLSFLIELYKTSGDRVLKKIIYYRLVEIYENSTQLYKSGLSKDFESVDFMLGLSGMGYECLRLKTDLPVISLLEI